VGGKFGVHASLMYYCFVENEKDIEVIVKDEIGYIEGSFCDFSKGL